MSRPNRGPHLAFMEKRGVYYIRWYVDGRERLRSTSTADVDDAQQALAEFVTCGEFEAPQPKQRPEWRDLGEPKVYFLASDEGPIKIGTTLDPEARMAKLQCGSPVKLSLLAVTTGGQRREWLYHLRFGRHRLHGEWFARHPDILEEIEAINASR